MADPKMPHETNEAKTPSSQPSANESVERDEAVRAATHGTEQAPHSHPAHVEHARETTGRHADDSWKKERASNEAEKDQEEP